MSVCECNKYRTCKKDHSWNPSIYICENSRFLKSIVDNSVTVCDKIILSQMSRNQHQHQKMSRVLFK